VIKIDPPEIAESEVSDMRIFNPFSSLFLLSCAALFACSGQVVPIGEHDQGLGSVPPNNDDAGGTSADAGTNLPTCETPTGPIHEFTSIADTQARLAGTWLLCSGGIGSPADTGGIELAADQAHFLVKSGATLVRGAGADYDRTVSFVDTTAMNGPGSYQMNLQGAAGMNMYFSRTSEDGKFLELNEATSAKQARYVRVSSPPPACAISGAPHAYTSIADVSARIAGKWSICSGRINSPADTRGLEVAAAQAYFLVDSSGSLVRGVGWDYERNVAIIDTTAMNGPGSYQINFDTGGAGSNAYFSRVSESGDVLELDEGTSGNKVVYRRVF
jgi:hypothetical protein